MTKNVTIIAKDKLDLEKAVQVVQALELADEHSKNAEKES